MTDILLIQPPVRDFYLTSKRTIPYGIACIASVLIEEGFSVDIFDGLATSKSRIIDLPKEMNYLREYYPKPDRSPFGLFHHYRHFGYNFEYIGKIARDSGAFLIGISALFTPYAEDALSVAMSVKKFHPGCQIVLGGHHPSALPMSVMENKAVDFVLRGEGEVSMPRLAKALRTGTDYASIPGIVFRKDDGTLQLNDPAAMIALDHFPLPATHLIKHHFYNRGIKGSAVITASRGCPMKCTYCSVGASSLVPYRRRSVTSVIKEIEMAVIRFNAGFIEFEDENLSLDKKWFLHLLDEIKHRFHGFGLELRAMNGLLPTSLDETLVCAMQAAGFRTLNLSLGSISEVQLRRFNRPDVREAFDNVLVLAEKYGLNAVGYVIVGAPFQSAEDSLSDLIFLAQKRVLSGVSVFYPAPGSKDFELCSQLNILPDTFSLMRSSALPLSHITTRIESVTLLRLGRILNFIKLLKDKGVNISGALMNNGRVGNLEDRMETGIKLLQMFLNDGKIRGMTPEGDIFEHRISSELSKKFIQRLRGIDIRGTMSSP
jgi:anaerobic magnesium-protoporphyrin IX monomethyl ester cyclase